MTPAERRLLLRLVQRRDKSLALEWCNRFMKSRLPRLSKRGLVEVSDTHVSLTPEGILIARRAKNSGGQKAQHGASAKRAIEDKG